MTNEHRESVLRRALPLVMLAVVAVLFALQLRSLFIFPEPNSIRWFGDETWLMSEARQQIATGTVTYPLAIGSQLAHGKGLVLSLTWLSSMLYGLPILVAGGDPVLAGRCVTAVLASILLIALYLASRRLGASRVASIVAILLLVSTRAFFFASHSARPDLLAGLVVLLVVVFFTRTSRQLLARNDARWFLSGAAMAFLAVSSSIHLVTLLLPVTVYFVAQGTKMTGGAMKRLSAFAWYAAGAGSMLGLLAFVYFITTGSLTLFPPSAQSGQFHDVLSAIPILRPFSRSVQEANLVIRLKQFAAEAPIILILPLIIPFVLDWKRSQRPLATATIIVVLCWLLLQGAEINYLMHLLPLLFLCLSIAITRMAGRWKNSIWVFASVAALAFLAGVRDSGAARASAVPIDDSNRAAVHYIENSIASTWRGQGKPIVLTEPPTLDRLSQDTSIRVMTDHFISFPEQAQPFDSLFQREQVDYAVLYNSPSYPKIRSMNDPFYQAVGRRGLIIARFTGKSGDIGRNYFNHSDWSDTVLLFKFKP